MTVSKHLYNQPPLIYTQQTALGMTELHLRIEDFKFTHNFIICNRLLDTEIIFEIDVQKKISLSYAWDKAKNCYIQKDSRFLTYTRNCDQKATIGIVKSTLKIPPRHNGFVPIKMKGHTITGHMAYIISNQDSIKGKDPNINIIKSFTTSKAKDLSVFYYPIIPTNTSCSKMGNM